MSAFTRRLLNSCLLNACTTLSLVMMLNPMVLQGANTPDTQDGDMPPVRSASDVDVQQGQGTLVSPGNEGAATAAPAGGGQGRPFTLGTLTSNQGGHISAATMFVGTHPLPEAGPASRWGGSQVSFSDQPSIPFHTFMKSQQLKHISLGWNVRASARNRSLPEINDLYLSANIGQHDENRFMDDDIASSVGGAVTTALNQLNSTPYFMGWLFKNLINDGQKQRSIKARERCMAKVQSILCELLYELCPVSNPDASNELSSLPSETPIETLVTQVLSKYGIEEYAAPAETFQVSLAGQSFAGGQTDEDREIARELDRAKLQKLQQEAQIREQELALKNQELALKNIEIQRAQLALRREEAEAKAAKDARDAQTAKDARDAQAAKDEQAAKDARDAQAASRNTNLPRQATRPAAPKPAARSTGSGCVVS